VVNLTARPLYPPEKESTLPTELEAGCAGLDDVDTVRNEMYPILCCVGLYNDRQALYPHYSDFA
jgi:hypothetical protein